MFLQNLYLEYFRNIESLDLEFDKNINIFLGKNGMGKTSILEAIAMLSIPKSFRTNEKKELLKFDRDHFRIKGGFKCEKELEIGYQAKPIQRNLLKIDGVKQSAKQFLKGAYVVTFVPQDLHLLDLGPSKRRAYLNRLLSKIDFMYLDHLSRYEKTMRERNAILKRINDGVANRNMVDVWDMQLIQSGSYLVKRRLQLISEISEQLKHYYREIAENKQENIEIGYYSKIHEIVEGKGVLKLQDGIDFDTNSIEELFEKSLNTRLDRDIATKSTSVGPHRDDFHFFLNNQNMEDFASRGEKRTILLALKVTELEIIKNHAGVNPLLLLDDVFSELDNDRQTQLLHLITPYQTFITTNSPDHFENFDADKTVWEVTNGIITRL